jgi:hypothetical protein
MVGGSPKSLVATSGFFKPFPVIRITTVSCLSITPRSASLITLARELLQMVPQKFPPLTREVSLV